MSYDFINKKNKSLRIKKRKNILKFSNQVLKIFDYFNLKLFNKVKSSGIKISPNPV